MLRRLQRALGPTVEPLASLVKEVPQHVFEPKTVFSMAGGGLLQRMAMKATGEEPNPAKSDFIICGIGQSPP